MGIYKKGKIFGIFNILDVLVLLAIVLVVGGLAIRNNLLNMVKVASSDSEIEFSIHVERLRDYSYDALTIGDTLYDSETGASLGKITDKKKTEYKERVDLPNGTVTFATLPDRYTVTITVLGRGNSTADGNYINGNRLVAPNGRIEFSTKTVSTEGFILSSDLKKS